MLEDIDSDLPSEIVDVSERLNIPTGFPNPEVSLTNPPSSSSIYDICAFRRFAVLL